MELFTEQDEAQILGPQATYEALQLARLRNRQLEDVLRRLLACPEFADIAIDSESITVRLSEWHCLQDANRAAAERVAELEARIKPAGALASQNASTLIDRLRQIATDATEIGGEPHVTELCNEAADRIAELEG